MNILLYNPETKLFSNTSRTDKLKDLLIIAGIGTAINFTPKLIDFLTKRYGAKKRDQILNDRQTRLNELLDNYSKEGIKAKDDPKTVEKYRNEIHKLVSDTLDLVDVENLGSYVDPDTHIRSKLAPNVFNVVIAPFISLIRAITIKELHILPGTIKGPDRRDFELVFDPSHTNPEDVARQPFRNVVYKHKWPSHGFEVTTLGSREGDELISGVVDFLATHPKFLSIRVK